MRKKEEKENDEVRKNRLDEDWMMAEKERWGSKSPEKSKISTPIVRYFGKKTKGKTYQLADYYTFFYLRFIKDNYGQDEHFWTHMLDNPKKDVWQGYSFEQLVKDHIEQVKRALGFGSVLTQQSSWFIGMFYKLTH